MSIDFQDQEDPRNFLNEMRESCAAWFQATARPQQKYFDWKPANAKTVSKIIHENLNVFSGWKTKKPFVSEKNRRARLDFCKKYGHWEAADWEHVVFTDESAFRLRFQGRRKVWKLFGEVGNPAILSGTLKTQRKVNVSGGLTAHGVTPLINIEGIMNARYYRDEVLKKLIADAGRIFKSQKKKKWFFQQDNDPKHTAKIVKYYLADKKIQTIEWPAQSPDLNPIENLWSILDIQCRARECKNEEELLECLEVAWNKLDKDLLKRLVPSMPARIQACIAANGYPTKY